MTSAELRQELEVAFGLTPAPAYRDAWRVSCRQCTWSGLLVPQKDGTIADWMLATFREHRASHHSSELRRGGP